MNATSMAVAEQRIEWARPARGRVGMFVLIAAEAAIFTIFVVAYLFYIGKSLTGPMPKDVLSVPIFYSICLLSSSLTIHLAAKVLGREMYEVSERCGSRPSRWARLSCTGPSASGTG